MRSLKKSGKQFGKRNTERNPKCLLTSQELFLIEAFIENIRYKAICLRNVPEEYHFERDPKHEPYLNLAIVANATYIGQQGQ